MSNTGGHEEAMGRPEAWSGWWPKGGAWCLRRAVRAPVLGSLGLAGPAGRRGGLDWLLLRPPDRRAASRPRTTEPPRRLRGVLRWRSPASGRRWAPDTEGMLGKPLAWILCCCDRLRLRGDDLCVPSDRIVVRRPEAWDAFEPRVDWACPPPLTRERVHVVRDGSVPPTGSKLASASQLRLMRLEVESAAAVFPPPVRVHPVDTGSPPSAAERVRSNESALSGGSLGCSTAPSTTEPSIDPQGALARRRRDRARRRAGYGRPRRRATASRAGSRPAR